MLKRKPDVKTSMLAHSEAKVLFYRGYIGRYLNILFNSPYCNKINIFDVFCGTGLYENGKKGSPLVTFDEIKKLKEKYPNNKTEIHFFINDGDQEKINNVIKNLKNHGNYCNLVVTNKNVEELFPDIINYLDNQESKHRAFLFIDPYGYKQIKKDILFKIMSNGKTEIILFLPVSHMLRFTSKALDCEEEQYIPLRNFIFSFFDDNHPVRNNKTLIKDYINHIKIALRFDEYFSTSYYLERDKANYYALFFMSNHIYGFEKILEVKWALDKEKGEGFDQLKSTEGQLSLFEDHFSRVSEENNYNKLKNLLIDYLKIRRNSKEIYKFVLENEYLPTHFNKVCKDLMENKIIEIMDCSNTVIDQFPSKAITYQNYKKSTSAIYYFKIK